MKRYGFKHFLNIDNVADARMFTGNSFHSRGATALNAESPIYFFRKGLYLDQDNLAISTYVRVQRTVSSPPLKQFGLVCGRH